MKIIRIITRLNAGGPTKHVTWLSKGFSSLGCDHVLIAGRTDSDEDNMELFFSQNGAGKIYYIDSMHKRIGLLSDIISIYKIYTLIRKIKPDVIHTHLSKAGLLGRIAAYLWKIENGVGAVLIHTYHGNTFSGYFGFVKSYLFIAIDKLLAKYCTDAIVAISKQQRSELIYKYKIGCIEQYRLINLGIDIGFSKKLDKLAVRKKYNLNNDEKIFGIVGRLAEIKNHRLFIDSAKLFLSKYPDAKVSFLIIGGGEKSYQDSLVALVGDEHRIKFMGYLDNPVEIYSMFDYLVLTSINEGTPVAILEAFCAEIPVIATNVGGVFDLLGINERGYIVEQNIQAISNSFESVLSDDHTKILAKAKKFALENYSIDSLINNLNGLYTTKIMELKCKN